MMLLGLRIENGVKYKDRTFTFEKGLTTISGPNGAGKSLIQEFIRFALFGTSALRGKLSDYNPNLRITLSIKIRDEIITITRTLKDCVISDADGEIVKGTTPCNEWVVNKLGYNMSVFDIGNSAKQFEINKLGDMKPSERKQAIDQVIGLSVVTKLIKSLKDEKNELKNFVKGFETALIEPVMPTAPDNYIQSGELYSEYLKKVSIQDNARFLKSKVEELKCEQVPEWEGEIPQGDLKNEALYDHYKQEIESLPKNSMEGSSYTRKELIDWLNSSNQWRDWREPEIDMDTIKRIKEQWVKYREWQLAEKVKCPNCGTEFVPSNIEEVPEPKVSVEYLREQENLWWRKPNGERPEVLIDQKFFDDEISKINNREKMELYYNKLDELGWVDYKLLRRYVEHQEKYKKYINYQEYESKLKALGDVNEIEQECISIWNKYTESKIYEEKLNQYVSENTTYNNLLKSISEKRERIEQLEKAITGLTNFTSLVKNSIIPSLSSVATNLCREMSDSEIEKIDISEDFEISVDGKELSLLSGSEKAIANLSIRLALSSVLTRKIFNVFIGDEIDESMSEQRANATAECLRRLSSQIEQIILISHKNIIGDNVIEV